MDFRSFVETNGRQLRQLFYLVTPNETSFASLDGIPEMTDEVIPWRILFIILEATYCWKKGLKGAYGLNDSITSIMAGFLQSIMMVVFRSVEIALYCWVYQHWHVIDMAWDSPWTWIVAFFAVDFAFYWIHRAGHEVNFLWAIHQMHHSSEHFNLTTSLRESIFEQYISIFFYLPAAFIIPPQVHLVHSTLNLLYQFWIHTRVVGTLGPLEKVMNTPSSHRVHHGRNRYCIDKNYGGVLIIWDRLFGTYQAELKDEPIKYGLVVLANSFDALYLQFFYLKYALWDKPRSMEGLGNKLKAVFYGPGWHPGTGRCGDLAEIPDVDQKQKPYNTSVKPWISVYALLHGLFALFGYQILAGRIEALPWSTRLASALLMFYSVQVLGYLLEKKTYAPLLEVTRCFLLSRFFWPMIWATGTSMYAFAHLAMMASALVWFRPIVLRLQHRIRKGQFRIFEETKAHVN